MTPTINVKPLNYSENGEGEVLCLLHGFLEDKSIWNPFIHLLANKYRVIAIDLPGHGKSELLHTENTMLDMARAVHDTLKSLGVESVNFIGHSMGGYVALAYADLFPKNVWGIVLLNSTPEADTEARKKLRKHGIKVARNNYEALISMSVVNLFTKNLREELRDEIAKTKEVALTTSPASYIACQNGMAARKDYSAMFKQGMFRKQIILGASDTLINADDLLEKFDSSSIDIHILNGGHMLHLENRQALENIFLNF